MQRSITEDVVIPKGSEIKLDLKGFTLTNMSGHTITNYGTLIIMDSLGDGEVDNITNQKAADPTTTTPPLNQEPSITTEYAAS